MWFSAPVAPYDAPAIVLDGVSDGPARNIAVMTNVAPEYRLDTGPDIADQDRASHTALIVAACPGMADAEAAEAVRQQLTTIFGTQVDHWRHLRTDVIHHGQPGQAPPFSPKQPVSLGDGLFVCGDHRDTASIQGALYSGRRCADAVLTTLAEQAPA